MANFTSGSYRDYEIEGIECRLYDTEEFEIESFGWLPNQPFPYDHFEVRPAQGCGSIASGKTTLVKRYYAHRIKQIWGDNVDFFEVESIQACVEFIINSDKDVHVGLIDDAVGVVDSRQSIANAGMTSWFYEIRHKLKEAAERKRQELREMGKDESEIKVGGLVILFLLTQDFMAIDKRLRNSLMFTYFKTYDEMCDKRINGNKLIDDPEIIDLLKVMKNESVRKSNYEYRKLAVGVDILGDYALFYADRDAFPETHFVKVRSVNELEIQKNELIDFLVGVKDLQELSKTRLKGKLGWKLKEWQENDINVLINRSHYTEIIELALEEQAIISQNNDSSQNSKVKLKSDKDGRFDVVCTQCGNNQKYKPQSLKKLFDNPRTECKECHELFYVDDKFLFDVKEKNQVLKINDKKGVKA